jgi:hypothetical protein
MELEAYHRALLALCFEPQQRAPTLPGFALYGEMVRARFMTMAKVAFRRSFVAIGEQPLRASFERYLSQAPPSSPFIREVIAGFAQFAERDRALLASAPPYARDLMCFESATWQTANALELPPSQQLLEVDFERVLVLNSTLRVLSLEYAVIAADGSASERPAADRHVLLVYRRPGHDDVRWYRVSNVLGALFELAHDAGNRRRLSDLVRLAVERSGESVDELLLERLASGLSLAVERGVVLGSQWDA